MQEWKTTTTPKSPESSLFCAHLVVFRNSVRWHRRNRTIQVLNVNFLAKTLGKFVGGSVRSEGPPLPLSAALERPAFAFLKSLVNSSLWASACSSSSLVFLSNVGVFLHPLTYKRWVSLYFYFSTIEQSIDQTESEQSFCPFLFLSLFSTSSLLSIFFVFLRDPALCYSLTPVSFLHPSINRM